MTRQVPPQAGRLLVIWGRVIDVFRRRRLDSDPRAEELVALRQIAPGAAGLADGLMSTLLYGITPLDPVTHVAVPLVLVTATVLASYLPARRAASVDPVEALRVE